MKFVAAASAAAVAGADEMGHAGRCRAHMAVVHTRRPALAVGGIGESDAVVGQHTAGRSDPCTGGPVDLARTFKRREISFDS